jgi:PAS domain S-box-containing protein
MIKRANILLVDDLEANLMLLRALVQNIDVNLILALSGAEALQKTEGVDLALAIIDVQMPKMNGYELALKLNEGRQGEKVPVIFITANYFDDSNVAQGYQSGAVDYIFKPVNRMIFISKVNIFLDLFNQKQAVKNNARLLKEAAEKLERTNRRLQNREKKMQQEQLFTKALLHSIPGIFYLYTLPELKLVMWNKQHETLFGYEPDEMKGRHVLSWHLPEKQDAVMESIKVIMDENQDGIETHLLKKDGSTIPFVLSGVKFESNGQGYLIGIGTDITEREKAENKLKDSLEQLQQLSKHIEQVRENERVSISRDLHDDLGQALTAVKIDLGIIKQKVSDTDVILKIDKVSTLVSNTIKTVQRLTSQLRPEIIDDLGLEVAIEWFTSEFAERNNIDVVLDLDTNISFSLDNSLILFRIMQESLTNIARHAKATEVRISMLIVDETIHFRISDNGIGISESDLNSKKSFGLIGMKERAASMGGICEISGIENVGSIIELTLPLDLN